MNNLDSSDDARVRAKAPLSILYLGVVSYSCYWHFNKKNRARGRRLSTQVPANPASSGNVTLKTSHRVSWEMQFLLEPLSPSNSLLLSMRWTTTPRGPSGRSGALYLRGGWAASSSCHSCESGESGVGCFAASGQLYLLGLPVAAGAGWGLGNDPALRTWGPLLVQVASLSRPSPFPYHFPVVS